MTEEEFAEREERKKIKVNNVMDFGARGNGETDDTDAIQKAINDLYKYPVVGDGVYKYPTKEGKSVLIKEGGIVYFPAGHYVVTKPITITKAGITLEGETPTVSKIMPIGQLKEGSITYDNEVNGNAVFDFVYYSEDGMTGNRSFIRNIGIKNLGFNGMKIDKTTFIRILQPYDLCVFENLIFLNLRGTAVEAISAYSSEPHTEKEPKFVGQGLVLRDIHIDNSATILLNNKETGEATNKLLDRGRTQDATAPVIHLENINESSLTNVKIIACSGEVGDDGKLKLVKDAKGNVNTIPGHAARIGVLTEGCQGITIKESAFAQLKEPAIQVQRGTYGKQQTGLFHFIQGNTFEETIGGGVKIDGGKEPALEGGRKGVSEVTISENRFLGNSTSKYYYMLDNCDLVTIKDRCSVSIGKGALNTTVHAVDINRSEEELKILDEGTRSIIMGRKYNFSDQTDAYTFSTRVTPRRFTMPVVKKVDLLAETSQKIEGDMALVQSEESSELAVIKRFNLPAPINTDKAYSLRWVNMRDELLFKAEINNVKEFHATDSVIEGTYVGEISIKKIRATAIFLEGKLSKTLQKTVVLQTGALNSDSSFSIDTTSLGLDILNCTSFYIEGIDMYNNTQCFTEVPINFEASITVNPYSLKAPLYLTGTCTSLIKSFRLVTLDSTATPTQGGTISNGSFNFYANGKVVRGKVNILVGLDAMGNERGERVEIMIID
ncbi:hypothetical protein HB911_11650 [Listeria booriae]|uniref:glycosyl hydrolase family 28-related protein n=1 Tax=Listeria booriae TaxID=1552123 RepID=UPI001625D4EE|nr:glycosyl hydrolase family 28-related protein [Listeria booriae]MBC1559352.1 hypothetical protein [Listeria booriae]MBC2171951.1 hypothetical protein [Listeria booriae]